ncbi:glycoside hydrolase family 36 N-terminal domain-containing protein [Mangrovibacterium lignilyticum]|uniref:glycoside hydrolase family 36 N-terminal domain-containing protein n=1 Tax=Mangrovibacterium lignilyticum TaxID=2668052 RepID=UPI0013D1B698|nr:glycoside hydrolase family 36 N-terminal domain-containing protein [Mangrovibacterium lignilyticum]
MKTYLKCIFYSLGITLFFYTTAVGQNTQIIEVKTKSTSLVYAVDQSERLVFQYYGKAVDALDNFLHQQAYPKPDTDRDFSYEAYPTFGLGNINELALSVIHADGSLNTELAFDGVETKSSQTGVS